MDSFHDFDWKTLRQFLVNRVSVQVKNATLPRSRHLGRFREGDFWFILTVTVLEKPILPCG